MEYDHYVSAAESGTAAMTAALAAGPLDVRVPTCPDWSLRDLARHAGEFTCFWAHLLCEGTGRPKTPFPDMPADPDVADWYSDLARHLVAELRAAQPTTTVWTWMPDDHTARFAARRVANELAVHSFDAQLARGDARPLDGDLAVDGIEEIFLMVEAWRAMGHPETGCGSGETIHIHSLDRHGEWLLKLAIDGLQVERRHGKGDLALRGSAGDLELLLYQRPPVGAVEKLGDPSVLEAWYRAFTFG